MPRKIVSRMAAGIPMMNATPAIASSAAVVGVSSSFFVDLLTSWPVFLTMSTGRVAELRSGCGAGRSSNRASSSALVLAAAACPQRSSYSDRSSRPVVMCVPSFATASSRSASLIRMVLSPFPMAAFYERGARRLSHNLGMRDPAVDLIRAVAVVGVIAGHWLVTALVAGPDGFTVQSPLRWMPELAPVSWLLQTLGLFFFAGGFAAARSKTALWLKVRRLAIPVAVVVGVWGLIIIVSGMPDETSRTVIHLVVSPLWFLGVYVILQGLTPVFRWLDERLGAWAILIPTMLTIIGEFTLTEINVLAVWWAPWQAGIVMARVGLQRAWGLPLLATGAVAYFVLVTYAGYPVSAVGGTGEARSNLAPPSPAALALAAAQIGLVLLLARPIRWRITNWLNRHALALFLLHQSALLTVTLLLGAFGVLPGLHTLPDHPMWVLARAVWLPAFIIALVGWAFALRVVPFGQTRSAQRNH